MDAQAFCTWLEESMAEDGWVQTPDHGEKASQIFHKIARYVDWLRKERDENHADPRPGNRKNSRN